jgi:hypothetical protein
VTGASILLPFPSSFVFVAGSQAAADAAAAFFGPAIAAITLGIMAHELAGAGPGLADRGDEFRLRRKPYLDRFGRPISSLPNGRRKGEVTISFLAYWRVGLPLALASLGFGTWWLA